MEQNYQIHDKEMLAIMHTLEEWRHFLEGSDQKFKIHMDHKNLSYFQEAHKLNRHQAHWSLYLSRFDFILTHKPGRQMGRPDVLSRQADHLRGADDNTDFTLLTLEVFKLRAMEAVTLEGEEATFMEQIQWSTQYDDPVVKALKWGDSAPMSGHAQKVLSCIEVGFMSWTTPSSIMTWCMHTMQLWLQDTLDDGRHWNWCCRTTGGQGCPGMSPSSLWGVMHATRRRPSLCRRWGS